MVKSHKIENYMHTNTQTTMKHNQEYQENQTKKKTENENKNQEKMKKEDIHNTGQEQDQINEHDKVPGKLRMLTTRAFLPPPQT